MGRPGEASALLLLLLSCASPDGGPDESASTVQRGPEVTPDQRHDSSRPLREIPPGPREQGQRVHEVKPIPRPRPPPDAGVE